MEKNIQRMWRRFRILKEENLETLIALCEAKSIGQEDLMLILRTLKLTDGFKNISQ
jgi:hypothetical protein